MVLFAIGPGGSDPTLGTTGGSRTQGGGLCCLFQPSVTMLVDQVAYARSSGHRAKEARCDFAANSAPTTAAKPKGHWGTIVVGVVSIDCPPQAGRNFRQILCKTNGDEGKSNAELFANFPVLLA